MKTTVEILTEAKALINTPERWTKGKFAALADGSSAHWDNPNATCYCIVGAIFLAEEHMNVAASPTTTRAIMKAVGAKISRDVSVWNDAPERTHAEVMDAFDRAIELAKAAE